MLVGLGFEVVLFRVLRVVSFFYMMKGVIFLVKVLTPSLAL